MMISLAVIASLHLEVSQNILRGPVHCYPGESEHQYIRTEGEDPLDQCRIKAKPMKPTPSVLKKPAKSFTRSL